MRRLVLLFAALLIAYWGQSIVRAGQPSASVALRDGGLILLLGLVIFAFAAPPLPQNWHRPAVAWPRLRALLFAAGIAGAAAGGWLLTADPLAGLLPLGLWLGGIALAGLAGLWPSRAGGTSRRRQSAAPALSWTVESARAFIRQHRPRATASTATASTATAPAASVQEDTHRAGEFWLLLGGVSLLGLLRLLGRVERWDVGSCVAEGCAAGLRAQELLRTDQFAGLLADPAPLYTLLAALFFGIFGADLDNLRLLGLVLGILAVPGLFLATVRLVGAASAALGALLLLFATWHIGLSLGAGPLALAVLLLLLFLWAWASAGVHNRLGWATAAGLLGGLVVLAVSQWAGLILLVWYALIFARSRVVWLAAWPLAAVIALPRLLDFPLATLAELSIFTPSGQDAAELLRQLLVEPAVWPRLTGLLALLGLAYLLRYALRWGAGRGLLLGVLLFAGAALLGPILPGPGELPLLLTLLLPVAVIGLAQFVALFAQVWRPVLGRASVYAGAAGLLLIFLGVGVVRGWEAQPAGLSQTGEDRQAALTVVGRYLQERFQSSVDNGGADGTLFLVPPALLNEPATQLAAGGVLPFARHIQPLEPVAHLPFAGAPFNPPLDAGVEYVFPADATDLFALLRQLYPAAIVEPLLDRDDTLVGWRLPVSREQIGALQGLPLAYFPGDAPGSLEDASLSQREGPLIFGWQTDPPLPSPFTLTGEGLLYAPESGTFQFQAQMEPDARLRLDIGPEPARQVLLDSAGGVLRGEIALPQGMTPLRLTFTSGAEAGDFALLWQRPGGKLEPIPRQALYGVPLPGGLLASYYAPAGEGAGLDGLEALPLLAERREPLLRAPGAGEAGPEAAGVIWRGKLAAPVEGQYFFQPQMAGRLLLRVNGIELLRRGGPEPARSAGGILLGRGWHDFELRLLWPPEGAGGLVWTVPGAGSGLVPPGYFAPLPLGVDASGLAIPSAPAAPSRPAASQPAAPQVDAPGSFSVASDELPTDLPELPLELMWQAGSCGSGPEELLTPRGVAVTTGPPLVFVADAGNRRVLVRSLADGALLEEIASPAFEEPFDLAADVLGNVYLLDAVSQKIWRLDRSEPVEIGVTETAFYRPRGLGVDITGQFFVADTGGARVVMFNESQVIGQFGGPDTPLGQGQPVDALALPNGAIWAVSAEDGRLWRLDTGQGRAVTARANTFDAPHFAGLTNSTFFLSDPERRLVLYLHQDGTPAGQFRAEQFAKPVGLAAAELDGRLLLAVSDSEACAVSVWSMPLDRLPGP